VVGLSSSDERSRQRDLAKECLGAGFVAWQALAKAEKCARLAAAELLAHEDKAVHSKRSGQKCRAKKRKKLEVKANGGLELQPCPAGKTSAECQDEEPRSYSWAALPRCVMEPDGSNAQTDQAKQHSHFEACCELDSSKGTNQDQGCSKEHGMSTIARPAGNAACCSAMLPLMPASLVAFETEVRNTFLHVPLPESLGVPVQRAMSAPPMRCPSSAA